MSTYLVVEGNEVYEIDQECMKQKQRGSAFRPMDRGQSENKETGRYRRGNKK